MFMTKIKILIPLCLSFSTLVSVNAYAVAVIDKDTEPYDVISPYAVSHANVSLGNVKAYRTWFENGTFTGDLIEYDVSAGGVLSTSIDLTVNPPTNADGGTNWSARLQFDAKNSSYWHDTRKIIFLDAASPREQKAFRWDNLSSSQKDSLNNDSDILDFIRGDQSNEKPSGNFRLRYNLLGDIIHSNPVYVAAPDSPFVLPGYRAFRNNTSEHSTAPGQADREARVYVGSNDGMLHAFDADTGNEVFAYVPSMKLDKLDKLSDDPASAHRYFVDGELNEGDADFGDYPLYEWHSFLVGGLGSGGRGLFALDITHANLSAESATVSGPADPNNKILFEINEDTDDDIGYIHGKVQVAKLPGDNVWRFVTGNGYDSNDKLAKLLLIDKDGNITEVSTDDTIDNNGLSAPTLIDIDYDFDIDVGYAGDLQGNLWKFDFNTSPVTASKFFEGSSSKPITSAPEVRVHPNGGLLIYFGTGSLLSATDAANTDIQSIYALWDGAPDANTTILSQTLDEDTYTYDDGDYEQTNRVRTASDNLINWATHKGWQVDLSAGERLITTPIMRADRLQFITHNPTTEADGSEGWLVELNYLNGGTGPGLFFDLNRDNNLNAHDKTAPDTPESPETAQIPIGIHLGNGSFSGPTIARVSNSRDTMFISGLFLIREPCTTNCDDGFLLGHIDVDTDSPSGGSTAATVSDSYCYENGDRTASAIGAPDVRTGVTDNNSHGLGGKTDGHNHEYDKSHGQVYVDFIDIEPLCGQNGANNRNASRQKLNRITEVGIPYDKKFIVAISNADLSPGSTLHIADQSWNVVAYQKLIQQKLDTWIANGKVTTPVEDANSFENIMKDGTKSLLFSIDDIKASTKKLFRHSFSDRAIVDGGLLPSKTNCVKDGPYETVSKDRWRGGALVTQLIDVEQYKLNIDWVVYQNPTDLYRYRTIEGTKIDLKVDSTNSNGPYDTFYGGLRARDKTAGGVELHDAENPAFLYESTLFWHYSGACYGSQSWDSDIVGAVNSNTNPSIMNSIAALEYDLERIEVALANPGISEEDKTTFENYRTAIEEKIQDIRDSIAPPTIEYSGTVTPPTDLTPDISPLLGPNFRTGRRSWIDLTPY